MYKRKLSWMMALAVLSMLFLTAARPSFGSEGGRSGLYHPSVPFTLPDGLPTHDYGDAPDSGNTAGVTFEAYPGVVGKFPTTMNSNGPWHDNFTLRYYLGEGISGEDFADSGFDTDVDGNNMVYTDTVALAANNDGFDDGLILPSKLPHCSLTEVEWTITVTDTETDVVYLNIWADWNRDGAWGGIAGICEGTSTGVAEWAVQNMMIEVSSPGVYKFDAPIMAWNNTQNIPMWLRIMVSDQMAPSENGSGPVDGYLYGETEDYLWSEKNIIFLPIMMGGGGSGGTPPPPDDDDTHVDESEPTDVQVSWPQIPTDDSSVVLDMDNLLLNFANNGDKEKQISYSLTLFSGGEKNIHRTEPVNLGPGDVLTEPVPVALLLPAVQAAREAARMLGEVMVFDLATSTYYNVEIPFIVVHPDESDPDGKIVAYNDLGLTRQMSSLQFDNNNAIGTLLQSLIPIEEDPSQLVDLIVFESADPVIGEGSEDPGGSDDFPPPTGEGSQTLENSNQSGEDSPDFTFTLCLEWYTAPIDNGFGEDYGTDDSGWRARGAKVKIYQSGNKIFDGYMNQYGCSYVNTTSTAGIYIAWKGEARLTVGGGYMTIRHLSSGADDSGDLVSYGAWIDSVGSGQVYRPEMWNFDSIGILAYSAQERFNGGVNGVTYYLKRAGCKDDPAKGSCSTTYYGVPIIFMSSSQYRRKFIVGHEYGHKVLSSIADYKNDCAHNGGGHGMTGIEYGSCAAMEGWGHFVAVDIWNHHHHNDTSDLNPSGIIVYWDGNNTVYNAEIGSDQPYCHQQYPGGLLLVCDFFGYELDWMRQWWDYHTNPGNRPSHYEMFQLIDAVVWENGTFDAAQSIKDVAGSNAGRWNSFVCWNGVAGSFYGCE